MKLPLIKGRERRDQVISTLASYSGEAGFMPRPSRRLL